MRVAVPGAGVEFHFPTIVFMRFSQETKHGAPDGNVLSHSPEIGSYGHQEGGGVEILGVKHS